ncbi:prolyl oligopeptidase family serine peptidase [Novosphingobium rosa]|uniref:prolyl oligopeptidase family serine peptidase n=1 Tax=Novosphingobium rosa TaxID=76978 RepID=UPI000AC7AC71|nr:prolyl oligopeptidase family serine peptidase [Novosphingobium rosa]
MSYIHCTQRLASLLTTAFLSTVTVQHCMAQPISGLTLNDIIESKSIDGLSPSPDGKWIAYRVISRSVAANQVQGQWFKVRLDGSRRPVALGKVFSPLRIPLMSLAKPAVSRWAPDSSALYTLSESGSAVQVHRLTPTMDVTVTHDAADVESFEISADGTQLTYQTRDAREAITRAQRAAEAKGFHFDRSIITDGLPLTDNFKIGDRLTTVRRVTASELVEAERGDLRTKHLLLRKAPVALPTGLNPKVEAPRFIRPQDVVAGEARLPLGTSGATIILRQIQKGDVDGQVGSNGLEADLPGGNHIVCTEAFCKGAPSAIRFVTYNDQTNEAVILAEPDFRSRTTIYAWNLVTGTTRVIRPETSSLDDGSPYVGTCPMSGHYLVCVESGPSRPPRLNRIDIRDGHDLVLVDPNAALAAKHFPQTQILTWRDPKGRPWNGVLVLPDGPVKTPLPTVITTYRCRGFLQGGVGYLASEFALAQKGMAALCINLNNDILGQLDASGRVATMQPYKDLVVAYQTIIDKLAHDGIADPSRIGIAGHSFTANGVTYAISHSQTYRAAVIGSGPTIDPGTYAIVAAAGDSWRKAVYRVIGLPKPSDDPNHVWKTVSPALNAKSILTPLLIQTPENEYLFNLQQYAFLQDAHKEVDMYVYPGEGHMASWQPVHQYWRNKRSVDWFAKWLLQSPTGG